MSLRRLCLNSAAGPPGHKSSPVTNSNLVTHLTHNPLAVISSAIGIHSSIRFDSLAGFGKGKLGIFPVISRTRGPRKFQENKFGEKMYL